MRLYIFFGNIFGCISLKTDSSLQQIINSVEYYIFTPLMVHCGPTILILVP